jgi:peptidoglycan/LPS O-acetylase OafA/YrhL
MLQEIAGQHPKAVVSRPPNGRSYRPELQGLRALAVLLVVIYHVWLGRVSGGVDVFFVISGFLLTGQLTRAAGRGRVEFRPLWGRMIKRLFPAALTVLVAVMAASILLLPESRWFQTIREVIASALYLENWQLAADSADYFAQNNGKSVVQHFWSLSIQGQLFIAWPLLIVGVALVARRFGGGLRTWVAGTLGVIGAASLAYSVVLTAQNQQLAYFHSLTRVWEFVLGGLLALFVDAVVLPKLVRVVMGWVGVVGLVSCGMILQVGSVFPGYAALWPTLCAVLVLLAGATASPAGADRLLSSRPLRYVGDLSYALYLWHWPVLLFYLAYRRQPEVGLKGGAVIIALSVGLAVLTHHLIEEPARKSRFGEPAGWGAYRFGAVMLVAALLAAGSWQFYSGERAKFGIAIDDPNHPGAAAQYPGFRYRGEEGVEPLPPLVALPDEWGSTEGMDCAAASGNQAICVERPAGTPVKSVVMIGDSHMQQYLAVMRPIAEKRNWELTAILAGACPFSSDAYVEDGQGCVDWNADARDKIIAMKPDMVFTQATHDVRVGLTEKTPPGFVQEWTALTAEGIPVVAVRDTPRQPFDPPTCVQQNGVTAPACATPKAELYADTPPYATAPDMPSGVSFVDFTAYFCDTVCPPVIGNVWVYRDFNHPTATYMRTLSPIVEEELVTTLRW